MQLRRDVLLIACILLIAGLLFVLFFTGERGSYAEVSVNGTVIARYSLAIPYTTSLAGVGGENTLVVENGSVRITHADCPDKLCTRMPSASHVGETIVCLPHKIVVQLTGDAPPSDNSDLDIIIQ